MGCEGGIVDGGGSGYGRNTGDGREATCAGVIEGCIQTPVGEEYGESVHPLDTQGTQTGIVTTTQCDTFVVVVVVVIACRSVRVCWGGHRSECDCESACV